MRVAGPSLTLSFLLLAAPALAQGGYYDSGSPYDRQQMNQNRYERYEYVPPPQDQMWQGPMHHGPMRYGQGQQNYATQPGPHWQMQPGSMMQQGMQGGYPPRQMGMGHMGQSSPSAVSSATQSQIKSSLESSGFKNVTVVPQSYLVRATAPDGSRVLMQVSSEGLQGVVVHPTDQGGSSGTGGGTSTSSTSSPGTSSASSSPSTSSPGSSSTSSSSSPGGGSTGNTSGTGGTTSSTGQSTNR